MASGQVKTMAVARNPKKAIATPAHRDFHLENAAPDGFLFIARSVQFSFHFVASSQS
jgi:hypothetical protein